MKSSFWVVCGAVLLCFGNVRCQKYFSDYDDNFLDKTGDELITGKEEDIDWELYKARTVWNDFTNEIDELSRMQNGPEGNSKKKAEPDPEPKDEQDEENDDGDQGTDVCENFCHNDGKCDGTSGTATCDCEGTGYEGDRCDKLEKTKCQAEKKNCDETEGTCKTIDKGKTVTCSCPEGKAYNGDEGCQDVCENFCHNGGKCDKTSGTATCDCEGTGYEGDRCDKLEQTKCQVEKKNCDESGGICETTDNGATVTCKCPENKEYNGDEGCQAKCEKDDDCQGNRICNANKFCVCKAGYEGKDCNEVIGCKELQKNCEKISSNCVFDDDNVGKGKCECGTGLTYNRDTNECLAKCEKDEDCQNNRICNANKFCVCNAGYEGNDCSEVIGCKELQKNCEKIGSNCVFDEDNVGKGKCECKSGLTYNRDTNECLAKCEKDKDCQGNRICNDNKICVCKSGYEGSGCNDVSGCKDLQQKCEEIDSNCVFDEDNVGMGKCECKGGLTYNRDTNECFVGDELCQEKRPSCKTTGGTCSVDSDGKTIKCDCKAGINYSEDTACNVPDALCQEKRPKCKDTGGTCSVDSDGQTIKCHCKAGISYSEDTACSVPDTLCQEKRPQCKDTGGTCSVDSNGQSIKCDCKAGFTYKTDEGCKETDYCKEKCGEKEGVKCNGDKTKKDSITCSCEDETQIFDQNSKYCKDKCTEHTDCEHEATCEGKDEDSKICKCKTGTEGNKCELATACVIGKYKDCKDDKGECTYNKDKPVKAECKCDEGKALNDVKGYCEEDKCSTECGISYTNKEADVKCTGGPFGEVKCECKENTKAFDRTDKECKTNYCKEKCGGESTTVKCDGNIFEESEVVCGCKDDLKDFDSEAKKCKTNYCKTKCGTGEHIECEGDHYKSDVKCKCDSDDYLYKNKKCIEKCSSDDECKHDGKCKGAEDKKICECITGITGDKCETIKSCETGKYKNCKGEKGECKFDKEKPERAVCDCSGDKKLYEALGYCEAKCEEDKNCDGSNRVCNKDKFCVCRDGYEGDDCNVVTGCNDLEKKCEEIGSKCVFDENNPGKGKCECKDGFTYNREENKCEDPYCHPNSPCKDKAAKCKFDDALNAGYCECPNNKYYNYKLGICEDLADKCVLKKTSCNKNEVCVNGECKCKGKKEGDECKVDLCKPDPCFGSAKCSETDGKPFCSCDEGSYFNNKCQKPKCSFTDYEKSCSCPTDFEKKDGVCVPKKEEDKECDDDCGYGLCISKKDMKFCKCFTDIATLSGGKCILKSAFCAGGKLQEDKKKCKCEGQFIQADDGITCRLKTCNDEDAKKDCEDKGAECQMNWKGKGYSCVCPKGLDFGGNGKCTDPCNIEKLIKTCADAGEFCYSDISAQNQATIKCGCPPTTFGTKCSTKAENVYLIKNIFVLKEKYELNSGINKALLSSDLMKSMERTFSDSVYHSGFLYDYRIEGSVLNCSVFINFKSPPSDAELKKVKAVPKKFPKLCEGCDDTAIVWPPSLLLSDKGLLEAESNKLEFCSNEVKDMLCGKGAKCIKEENKCTCDDGFKLIEYSITERAGYKIQRCEDINECDLGIDTCNKKNTDCVNTFGSYKCVCKEGLKKKETPKDPETDKSDCVDMCTPSPCKKGKCALKDKTFDCQCQAGVTGSYCDREDANYKSAKHSTVVVGAVLGSLLGVVAIVILFYIIKKRKRSGSEDFRPAARMDHAEMAERRGMRGVSNKAYE